MTILIIKMKSENSSCMDKKGIQQFIFKTIKTTLDSLSRKDFRLILCGPIPSYTKLQLHNGPTCVVTASNNMECIVFHRQEFTQNITRSLIMLSCTLWRTYFVLQVSTLISNAKCQRIQRVRKWDKLDVLDDAFEKITSFVINQNDLGMGKERRKAAQTQTKVSSHSRKSCKNVIT